MPIDQALSSLMSELTDEAEATNPEEEVEETEEVLTENENDEAEEAEAEAEDSEDSTLLITEKIAKEAGLPKELIGKPIDELGKSYRNLLADYTKKASELAELKKVQVKDTPKEAEKELSIDEMPDPIEDIEGFKEWMKRYDAQSKSRLKQELKPIEDAKRAQSVKDTFDNIADAVGKNVDIKTLIDEWGEHSGLSEEDYEIYTSNPKRLIKPVIDYYYAKAYKQQLMKQKAKTNEAEILKQKSIKPDGAKLVSYSKGTRQAEDTAVQRLLKDLQS